LKQAKSHRTAMEMAGEMALAKRLIRKGSKPGRCTCQAKQMSLHSQMTSLHTLLLSDV